MPSTLSVSDIYDGSPVEDKRSLDVAKLFFFVRYYVAMSLCTLLAIRLIFLYFVNHV